MKDSDYIYTETNIKLPDHHNRILSPINQCLNILYMLHYYCALAILYLRRMRLMLLIR